VVAKDRTPASDPSSKKLAIFAVTNVLFKVYFKVNTLQLCGKLINVVEGILVSMSVRDMTIHYISRSFMNFSSCLFSLCILRTHIESRFCNTHVVILLN
jgi:hypothetical protein